MNDESELIKKRLHEISIIVEIAYSKMQDYQHPTIKQYQEIKSCINEFREDKKGFEYDQLSDSYKVRYMYDSLNEVYNLGKNRRLFKSFYRNLEKEGIDFERVLNYKIDGFDKYISEKKFFAEDFEKKVKETSLGMARKKNNLLEFSTYATYNLNRVLEEKENRINSYSYEFLDLLKFLRKKYRINDIVKSLYQSYSEENLNLKSIKKIDEKNKHSMDKTNKAEESLQSFIDDMIID